MPRDGALTGILAEVMTQCTFFGCQSCESRHLADCTQFLVSFLRMITWFQVEKCV